MQWIAHDNTAPNNVGAIPSDLLQPLAAVLLLVAYRRTHTGHQRPEADPSMPNSVAS